MRLKNNGRNNRINEFQIFYSLNREFQNYEHFLKNDKNTEITISNFGYKREAYRTITFDRFHV